MKTFTVLLKDGRSMEIKAARFERGQTHSEKPYIYFYGDDNKRLTDVYLVADEVSAISPKADGAE
jgi:hypothetical protein